MKNHIIYFILSILFSGCVSVELPNGKVKQATDVSYNEPEKPFEEIKPKNSDKTWLSKQTGNTISFLSECGNSADPSLKNIENDSLSGLNDLKSMSTEVSNFNGREALISTSTGSIDGVAVKISLVIFKKNGCNYTLSYGGIEKQYAAEESIFEKFKANFKAP